MEIPVGHIKIGDKTKLKIVFLLFNNPKFNFYMSYGTDTLNFQNFKIIRIIKKNKITKICSFLKNTAHNGT